MDGTNSYNILIIVIIIAASETIVCLDGGGCTVLFHIRMRRYIIRLSASRLYPTPALSADGFAFVRRVAFVGSGGSGDRKAENNLLRAGPFAPRHHGIRAQCTAVHIARKSKFL